MLTHLNSIASMPEKILVLGAGGFLGKPFINALSSLECEVFAPNSNALDLAAPDAVNKLADFMGPDVVVVFLSALTPDRGRGRDVFFRNLSMAGNVCAAVEEYSCQHLVYASSDAVYSLETTILDELTGADAMDLYGIMHRAREIMLESVANLNFATVRISQMYGPNDPHNSYGPNRFRSLARETGKIELFGGGEEKRDHVYVEDAVRLLLSILELKSTGILNIATGISLSFDEVAQAVAKQFDNCVVEHSERKNPITHRHFDVHNIRTAFPKFSFTPFEVALGIVHAIEIDQQNA